MLWNLCSWIYIEFIEIAGVTGKLRVRFLGNEDGWGEEQSGYMRQTESRDESHSLKWDMSAGLPSVAEQK